MTSLDTNIVLRFLLDDVPGQTARAAELIGNSRVYVTDVVMTEVIVVLEKVYKLSHGDVTELVSSFLGLSGLVYNQLFLVRAIDLYGSRPQLSFVDCYAALEAEVYHNKLATFDKALARHGGSHVQEI